MSLYILIVLLCHHQLSPYYLQMQLQTMYHNHNFLWRYQVELNHIQIHIIPLVAFFSLLLLEETKHQEQKLSSDLNLKLPGT